MPFVTVNDGTRIHYEEQGEGRPLVMIHGWSFSGRFFHRNVPELAKHARVITLDTRGHGKSDKPSHGYRVARCAADVRDVLEALDLSDATLLGWSIGCPIIWSYLELFGRARVRDAIFVQQTPRQYFSPDWKNGHATCYDQAGLTFLQQQLSLDPKTFDAENLDACTAKKLPDEERDFLLAEMAQSPAFVRSALMEDHTSIDWRDLLPVLDIPSIMLVAEKDAVLVPEGPAWVAAHMPQCREVRFEESAHMIFTDEEAKFNATVIDFLKTGR